MNIFSKIFAIEHCKDVFFLHYDLKSQIYFICKIYRYLSSNFFVLFSKKCCNNYSIIWDIPRYSAIATERIKYLLTILLKMSTCAETEKKEVKRYFEKSSFPFIVSFSMNRTGWGVLHWNGDVPVINTLEEWIYLPKHL